MLTQWITDVVMWFLDGLLTGLENLLPAVVFDWIDTLAANLPYLLQWGPASAIGVAFLLYVAVDLALNGISFAVRTYRLIPVKST